MGKCCSTTQNQEQSSSTVQIDNKLFNQDITVRKGMKSGAQVGRTDDGDIEAGLQMFQKRKIKKYSLAFSAALGEEAAS